MTPRMPNPSDRGASSCRPAAIGGSLVGPRAGMATLADAHRRADRKRHVSVELRDEADNLVFRTETLAEPHGNGGACPARGPALPVPLVTAGPAISGLSPWPGDQANGGDYSD